MSPGRDSSRGAQRTKYPLNPAQMGRTCRELARDLRAEAAMDWPPVPMAAAGTGTFITRAEAARRMDEQAARWEAEAGGGPRNVIDREKIGH